ncbi:MAG TPA: hypothetical protein VMJ75_21525 [Candidatus Acidoferrales bacterium]|nr:hypothetical protein [Candidatus Acidoferrales bacterium]
MEMIVIAEDELRRLERRFGPHVRQMGAWNSDGTFGYSSVPLAAVEKAVENSGDPDLMMVLPRLKHAPDRAKVLIESLETHGSPLIERIVAAYREWSSMRMARSSAAGSQAA